MIPIPEEFLKKEKTRLKKEQEKLQLTLERYRKQLENVDFITNAPAELIEKHKKAMAQAEKELQELLDKLEPMHHL